MSLQVQMRYLPCRQLTSHRRVSTPLGSRDVVTGADEIPTLQATHKLQASEPTTHHDNQERPPVPPGDPSSQAPSAPTGAPFPPTYTRPAVTPSQWLPQLRPDERQTQGDDHVAPSGQFVGDHHTPKDRLPLLPDEKPHRSHREKERVEVPAMTSKASELEKWFARVTSELRCASGVDH